MVEAKPATLLTEALTDAGDNDDGGLGVHLTHLVPPVIPVQFNSRLLYLVPNYSHIYDINKLEI
jgi:hypothetical protein